MFRRKKRKPAPPPCPQCGGPTVLDGSFCRGCGWDRRLAESDDAYLDGIDVSDAFDEDDYAAALDREGLRGPARRPSWIAVVAFLLLVAWVLTYVL